MRPWYSAWDEEQERLRRIELAATFAANEVPPEADLNERLRNLPFANELQFFHCLLRQCGPAAIEDVAVDRILGTCVPKDRSWEIEPSSFEKTVWGLAKLIKDGRFDYERNGNGVDLVGFGGVYFVNVNGRHRVAAMKGMLGPPPVIRARVHPYDPFIYACDDTGRVRLKNGRLKLGFWVSRDNSFHELEIRRRAGLWEGGLVRVFLGSSSIVSRTLFGDLVKQAIWHVANYRGPWVFAKNEQTARSIYESVL